MAKVRVAISGTVGKSVLIDVDLEPRIVALETSLKALGEKSVSEHRNLTGLTVGDDHPQYTMWQAPEVIAAPWVYRSYTKWETNGLTEPGIEVWRDDGVLQPNITSTGYALQGGGTFHGNFARGTRAAPAAAQAADITGGIGSRVYNGAAFQSSSPASLHWQVTENIDATHYGMWLRFLTTPKASTTRQERGGITDNGTFWCHDTGTYDATLSAQTQPISDSRFVASATIGASTGASFTAAGYGNGITAGFRGATARGTAAAATASQADDFLCFMGGHGHDGTSFTAGTKALIGFKAQQNWTGANQGAYVTIETTPNGSTTRAQRVRVTGEGLVGVGTSTPQKLLVVSNAGAEGFEVDPISTVDTVRYLTYDRIAAAYQLAQHEASQFDFLVNATAVTRITAGGELQILRDNDELQLGASQDLHLYHDGTDSWVRNDTGALKLASGATSIFEVTAARASFKVPAALKGYTVATLPAGAGGDYAYVTDALAPTFGAVVVGGGAIATPVFYNGANWTCR